jgi:hypothetical protein
MARTLQVYLIKEYYVVPQKEKELWDSFHSKVISIHSTRTKASKVFEELTFKNPQIIYSLEEYVVL